MQRVRRLRPDDRHRSEAASSSSHGRGYGAARTRRCRPGNLERSTCRRQSHRVPSNGSAVSLIAFDCASAAASSSAAAVGEGMLTGPVLMQELLCSTCASEMREAAFLTCPKPIVGHLAPRWVDAAPWQAALAEPTACLCPS